MAGDVSLVEVMARLVAAFAIIIGMLGGAVYVFRRRGMIRVTGGGGSVTKRMRVVERHNLSRSTSIAIVRIGGNSYLVGTTDHNVSMLADVTETIAASDELDARAAEAADNDPARQGTGALAGREILPSPRMDLVGAILQRMNRRV